MTVLLHYMCEYICISKCHLLLGGDWMHTCEYGGCAHCTSSKCFLLLTTASIQSMEDQPKEVLSRECNSASMLQRKSFVQEEPLTITVRKFHVLNAEQAKKIEARVSGLGSPDSELEQKRGQDLRPQHRLGRPYPKFQAKTRVVAPEVFSTQQDIMLISGQYSKLLCSALCNTSPGTVNKGSHNPCPYCVRS